MYIHSTLSFLVSSIDVSLVDLNHFSSVRRHATPRQGVASKILLILLSYFSSSRSLLLCITTCTKREEEKNLRVGMNSSLEAHTQSSSRAFSYLLFIVAQ